MKTYIVFLRGINAGGHAMVSMKELTSLIEGLGCKDVRTYLNSGNVILNTLYSEEDLRVTIETKLDNRFEKRLRQ